MNGMKIGAGYGSLIAGILLTVARHFGFPVTEEMVNYLSGILVMVGGGILHTANPPKR